MPGPDRCALRDQSAHLQHQQQAYIFAQDVNIDVISAVKERRLTGVTIETTTVRQYNTVAAAHLLGHVGDIQSSNWDYYREQGYSMNDKVGIDGGGERL